MKHYYIRETGGVNVPTTKLKAENILQFRGYRVYEETEVICIICK